MAVVKKISELTAKGSNIGANDLVIVGVSNGTDYDLKSVTGNQLVGAAVAQTITNGVTTTAPSQDAVFDALDLKVDKVTGSRLITSAEGTILGNTSGTNTGDQTLQTVTNLGNDTTTNITSSSVSNRSTFSPSAVQSAGLTGGKLTSIHSDGKVQINTTGSATGVLKASNLAESITLEFPNKVSGTYTVATTADFSGTNTGDQTFLNARVQTVTSSATVTPVSTNDLVIITAQAAGLTLANPTGTFTEGQALMIRIKDNGTARTIAFDTNYRAIGVTLPTTTVISKTLYLGIIYNSTDGKWDVVGTPQQA